MERSRPRRLRQSHVMREVVAETTIRPAALMMPYFLLADAKAVTPIGSLPGQSRMGEEKLIEAVDQGMKVGLRQVMLFGVPDSAHKDLTGLVAARDDGVVPSAVRALRRAFGTELIIATDVCLCAYLAHGHCGLVDDHKVLNDASLPALAEMACAHARAGADIVAPSDMMDGRIGYIRDSLDRESHEETLIMSYSVKYASAYYGPFREAAGSAPSHGDRKTYQMDPRNRREAAREVRLDILEGADMLMVKPALAYLDIVADVRRQTDLPIACYNVSGEYALVKAGARAGLIDEPALVRENLLGMRRAGADIIVTYHAVEALQGGWLSA